MGSAFSVEDVVRKCNVLRAHCEKYERLVDAVLRTHKTTPLVMGKTQAAIAAKQEAAPSYLRDPFLSSEIAVTPSESIEYYNALIQAGIQYFIITLWQNDLEKLHILAHQAIPALIKYYCVYH